VISSRFWTFFVLPLVMVKLSVRIANLRLFLFKPKTIDSCHKRRIPSQDTISFKISCLPPNYGHYFCLCIIILNIKGKIQYYKNKCFVFHEKACIEKSLCTLYNNSRFCLHTRTLDIINSVCNLYILQRWLGCSSRRFQRNNNSCCIWHLLFFCFFISRVSVSDP
jgi:hypothetical protein